MNDTPAVALTALGEELAALRESVHQLRGLIESGETYDMSAIDDLRTAVGEVRTKVDAAIARLSDNPTPEQVREVVADLQGIGSQIDTIDPDQPGGVQPGDVDGGEVPA